MFKFKKRSRATKPSSSRVRLGDDDEDDVEEDNDETLGKLQAKRRKTSKKSKANRTVIRSFQHDDDDDGDATTRSTSKNNRKGRGMGFGGGTSKTINEDEDKQDEDGFTAYDKDTLIELLADQKSYVPPPEQEEAAGQKVEPIPPGERLAWEQPHEATLPASTANNNDTTTSSQATEQPSLPDYLPLNKTDAEKGESTSAAVWKDEPQIILTGDEALSRMQQQQQQQQADTSTSGGGLFSLSGDRAQCGSPLEDLDRAIDSQNQNSSSSNKEEAAWEAEVTRRAGLQPSTVHDANQQERPSTMAAAAAGKPLVVEDPNDHTGKSSALLAQLKSQILNTVSQLQDQQDDMERRIERRNVDLQTNQVAVQRHESELSNAGSALEFYQKWRNRLCLWAGAIRKLHLKVEPILLAHHELEGELSAVSRWQDWENDVIAVLQQQQQGLLVNVLGRQPPPLPAVERVVDEFGRDVKSQYVMQREKRRSHRQRIHSQRQARRVGSNGVSGAVVAVGVNSKYIRGDESDAFVSDGEEETFRERHKSLRKALAVAMDELEKEYTVLQNLVDLFEQWRKEYPEEYKQCFASLSLADLAGILVQAELCSLNDPWNESGGYNEARWTAVVHSALTSGTMDEAAVERLIEKWVLPTISDLLDKNGINLASSRQTRSFGSFVSHLVKLLPPGNPVWVHLRGRVTAYIKTFLSGMAVPILSKTSHEVAAAADDEQDEVKEAIYAATWGQMHRIKKIMLNLLMYWVPFLDNDAVFIELVLDFISNKFLFLLSSLQGVKQEGLAESPADVFRLVYQNLLATGWLDLPGYMIQSATIRAAAAAYNAS